MPALFPPDAGLRLVTFQHLQPLVVDALARLHVKMERVRGAGVLLLGAPHGCHLEELFGLLRLGWTRHLCLTLAM